MKKNKFIYSLSAIALACIISFSGIGNSYIQVHATSVGIEKGVWNDDVSAWENIRHYIQLFASAYGIYVNPSWQTILWGLESHNDFYNFMVSDGYSEEDAEEIVHGGGGHVRDGISVDDDGNVTYSDEVSDLFHGYILNYVDSNSGYILVSTRKYTDLNLSHFPNKTGYDNLISSLAYLLEIRPYIHIEFDSKIPHTVCSFTGFDPMLFSLFYSKKAMIEDVRDHALDSEHFENYDNFYAIHNTTWKYLSVYDSTNVKLTDTYPVSVFDLSVEGNVINSENFDLTNLINFNYSEKTSKEYDFNINSKNDNHYYELVSLDGSPVKIWYDVDIWKQYNCNKQPYYITDSFLNFDSSQDNSTTISKDQYNYYENNGTAFYETIQNNINNYGGELDEKTVQDIVDAAVQEMKDTIANSGNQGGNDSGDSSDGGNGIGNLVDGIGKLLDTILSLIGKVMGVVADFTQSILDLFSGFTDFTDGFSNFLSGAFSFIPQEIWNVIQVGLSLMILLAVIKFLRK